MATTRGHVARRRPARPPIARSIVLTVLVLAICAIATIVFAKLQKSEDWPHGHGGGLFGVAAVVDVLGAIAFAATWHIRPLGPILFAAAVLLGVATLYLGFFQTSGSTVVNNPPCIKATNGYCYPLKVTSTGYPPGYPAGNTVG